MGDFSNASYCSPTIVHNRLAMGHHLEDVHRDTVMHAGFLRRSAVQDAQDMLLSSQRLVQQLRGHSSSFDTLDGEGFEEPSFEARLPKRMGTTQCIYWVNNRDGKMQSPVQGGFEGNVGLFFGEDTDEGRPVKVVYKWTRLGPDFATWEQAFSYDGGRAWETNWKSEHVRVKR